MGEGSVRLRAQKRNNKTHEEIKVLREKKRPMRGAVPGPGGAPDQAGAGREQAESRPGIAPDVFAKKAPRMAQTDSSCLGLLLFSAPRF